MTVIDGGTHVKSFFFHSNSEAHDGLLEPLYFKMKLFFKLNGVCEKTCYRYLKYWPASGVRSGFPSYITDVNPAVRGP